MVQKQMPFETRKESDLPPIVTPRHITCRKLTLRWEDKDKSDNLDITELKDQSKPTLDLNPSILSKRQLSEKNKNVG
jgi:hypothetical protein